MALHLSGKQRAARVPIDYYKGTDPRLFWFSVLGGGGALLLLIACVASGSWKQAGSPGPVHSVHAAWETDCQRCHTPGQPTAAANALRPWLTTASATDANCQTCHQGPQHHAKQIPQEVGSCASCHREHRGRAASLTDVADTVCTACHANLPSHATGKDTIFANSVLRFDESHPLFQIEDAAGKRVELKTAKDPGKLYFNHALHLTAGLKPRPNPKLPNVRLLLIGDIKDANARELYRKQQAEVDGGTLGVPGNGAPVKLECVACHQLDSKEVIAAPGRSAGDYMLPISYERHCRACHPLTFDSSLPSKEIPHGLQAEDVRRFLWGAYAEHRPAAPGANAPPLPGEGPSRKEESARQKHEGRIKAAEELMFPESAEVAERYAFEGKTTCGLCHQYDKPPGLSTPRRIVPPGLVDVWFPHAAFDHRSHRAVDCMTCHANARTSTNSSDVMLPDRDTCLKCHGTTAAQPIRSQCTTCHRYHNGDHAEQGLGASARAPKRPAEHFLSGP